MRTQRFKTGQAALLVAIIFAAAASVAGLGRHAGVANANQPAAGADITSYAIGYDVARDALAVLESEGVTFDAESMVRGFRDALAKRDARFSDIDMEAALTRLEREVSTRLAEERVKEDPVFRALAEENARKSGALLQRFSQREGAESIGAGVWRIVMNAGEGPPPGADDIVTISFSVANADGSIVAQRIGKQVRVSGMIDGGRRALERMSPGARWVIAIPAEQAFGIGGLAPDIGPNQALIVDCTLESVER